MTFKFNVETKVSHGDALREVVAKELRGFLTTASVRRAKAALNHNIVNIANFKAALAAEQKA